MTLILPPCPKSDPCTLWLIVGSALSVNKICIIFQKTKMINLKPNLNPYRSRRRSVSISNWPEITYFAKLISNIFQLVDRGNNTKHGIWNNPVCLVYQRIVLSEFTQTVEDYETENKTWVDTGIQVRENGGSLDGKFRSRRELGLPTLSAVVHPRKMMPRTMFRSMQTFCEWQIY